MANQEHLAILKQGAKVWNKWRKKNPEIRPDLTEITLLDYDAVRVAEYGFEPEFKLCEIDLSEAVLYGVHFENVVAERANLDKADLRMARIYFSSFKEAKFRGAHLGGAYLRGNILSGTDFSYARLWETTFAGVNLTEAQGLSTVIHEGPSTIGIDTIYLSLGHIPEAFLKKAGVPDSFLTYMSSLVVQPIDYYTCFISYSSKDHAFAKRLHADLQSEGVRCWFAPEDMKIGDKIRPRIDEAISRYDKMMIVLSEHSIESDWIEKEVETALERERQQKRLVLFPIRLDDTVMQAHQAWAADIRRMRHIGDFTKWKHHDDYQKALNRLLRDLKAEAQKIESRDGTPNGRKL